MSSEQPPTGEDPRRPGEDPRREESAADAPQGQPPASDPRDVPPAAMPYPSSPEAGGGSPYAGAPEAGGGSPYQNYPGYPGGPPAYPGGAGYEPVAQVPQPSSIRTAVMLMYAGAALSVLGLLVGLLTLSSLKDNVRSRLQDNGTFTESDLNNTYHAAVALIVVAALIGIVLWLWMAWKNGQGRSWARIVATVLAALNILSFIANLAQGQQTAGTTVLSVISVLLAIAILILIWRPESSAYYASVSAARRARYR